MQCSNCGAELSEGSNFCGACGTPVAATSPAADQGAIAAVQPPAAPAAYQQLQPPAYSAQPTSNVAGQGQQAYVAPDQYASAQNVNYAAQGQQPYTPPNYSAANAQQEVLYPRTESDKTLYLIAFIINVVTCVGLCWLIIPLAWLIPMTVYTWGIYQGKKPNTTTFGVCTLIFCDIVSGILLLVAEKDR